MNSSEKKKLLQSQYCKFMTDGLSRDRDNSDFSAHKDQKFASVYKTKRGSDVNL